MLARPPACPRRARLHSSAPALPSPPRYVPAIIHSNPWLPHVSGAPTRQRCLGSLGVDAGAGAQLGGVRLLGDHNGILQGSQLGEEQHEGACGAAAKRGEGRGGGGSAGEGRRIPPPGRGPGSACTKRAGPRAGAQNAAKAAACGRLRTSSGGLLFPAPSQACRPTPRTKVDAAGGEAPHKDGHPHVVVRLFEAPANG